MDDKKDIRDISMSKDDTRMVNVHDELSRFKDILKTNQAYQFVSNKLERLASAVHLLTKDTSRTEPLREELRKKSLLLVDIAYGLPAQGGEERDAKLKEILSTLSHLGALSMIAESSGMISTNNARVLRVEYEKLFELLLRGDLGQSVALEMSQSVLETEETLAQASRRLKKDKLKGQNVSYGTENVLEKRPTSSFMRRSGLTEPSKINAPSRVEKHSDRRQKILAGVGEKGRIQTKDILSLFPGVSGKTVQREILSLVSEGILRKEGERRWSWYRLP